jgi:hypothetical protein
MHCLFQSSYTASAIAVYLHQPVQYIFISLCSISALPLAVLLFRDADIMKKYGLYSFKWKIIPNFVAD